MKNSSLSPTKPEPEIPATNAFALLLAGQRNGECLREASEKLNDLVQKLRERVRPGEILLRIRFTPGADASIVAITDEIVVKLPKQEKKATIMFTTEDGTLTRQNPEQRELVLREVPKADGPLKEAAEPTAAAAS